MEESLETIKDDSSGCEEGLSGGEGVGGRRGGTTGKRKKQQTGGREKEENQRCSQTREGIPPGPSAVKP